MVGTAAVAIARRVDAAIAARVFPGCVVGVIDTHREEILACGNETYESGARDITRESLYDCASLTKSVVTATLALQLIDAKKLSLDDQLISSVPEYSTRFREDVQIRHLLTYTLGNSLLLSRAGDTSDAIFNAVCTEDTQPPGTVFNYSNTPAFLLGSVIERITGSTLGASAQTALFEPMGMKTATFSPRGAVPSEEGIRDVPHDESARVFAREGKTVGHAGLFATMPDLFAFMTQVLAHQDGRISTNQIAHLGVSTALGWELDQPWMGDTHTEHTFGKTGFTGCSMTANFDAKKAVIILSNRTYPHRPADRRAIDDFRKDVCDIVFT